MADRLRALTCGVDTPSATVAALLSLTEVFGEDLPQDLVFRELLTDAVTALSRDGASRAVRALALA